MYRKRFNKFPELSFYLQTSGINIIKKILHNCRNLILF